MAWSVITCRRCARPYELRDGTVLPACPYCGASPRRLLARMRDNRVAATLALLALVSLGVSFSLPFLSIATLGEQRRFSLVGGIVELWRDSHHLIAVILFLFSVVFPVAKLAAILLATSRAARLTTARRQLLHRLADATGKYSLLDVVVVAVLIVLFKFEGKLTVDAEVGVVWFCAGVLLSIAAGLAVRLDGPETTRRG